METGKYDEKEFLNQIPSEENHPDKNELDRQSMQVSYNRLKNPSKNLWCNRQAKQDRQKLVNLVVPDKSEKFPGSQTKLGYGNKHPKGPVWWSTYRYLEEYKL